MIVNDINLGGICNLDCEFCGEKNSPIPSSNDILKQIDIIKCESSNITITGGEPTIRPDFFEILDICLNKFDNILVISNLLKFNDNAFFDEFIKRDISKISISTSLDSHIEEIHDKLCNRVFYKEKIQLIDKIYNYKFKEITIGVVVNKINLDSMEEWNSYVSSKWPNADIFFKVYNPFNADISEIQKFLPLYGDVYNILNTIISNSRDKSKYRIAYIPICELKNLVKYSIEYNWILASLKKENGIKQIRDLFKENVFHFNCEKCTHFEYCLGIHKSYYYIYDDKFLKPVTNVFLNWEVNNEL